MAIQPIRLFGDPVLVTPASEVVDFDKELRQLVADLTQTMQAAPGAGLAAPQIGLPIRLFVIDGTDVEDINPKGFKQVFLNATIIDEFGNEWDFEEGCLSIPNVRANVKRKGELTIHFFDENWQEHTQTFNGMAARIIQHEYDHIEGILFTDRVSPLKRGMIKKRLDNISKGYVDVNYKMKFPKR